MVAGPAADEAEHDDPDECEQREPGRTALSLRHYDERREQGADGRSQIAADLEQRLGQTGLVAGRHAGDPGGFRVEDGGAHADQHGRQQHGAKAACLRQVEQPHQREAHAQRQGVGHGSAVGIEADQGLQQRGRELVGEGDETYLGERQIEPQLQEGIDGQQYRLHHVVQQVREADGGDHRISGGSRVVHRGRGGDRGVGTQGLVHGWGITPSTMPYPGASGHNQSGRTPGLRSRGAQAVHADGVWMAGQILCLARGGLV